jgi:hypothetical protein
MNKLFKFYDLKLKKIYIFLSSQRLTFSKESNKKPIHLHNKCPQSQKFPLTETSLQMIQIEKMNAIWPTITGIYIALRTISNSSKNKIQLENFDSSANYFIKPGPLIDVFVIIS